MMRSHPIARGGMAACAVIAGLAYAVPPAQADACAGGEQIAEALLSAKKDPSMKAANSDVMKLLAGKETDKTGPALDQEVTEMIPFYEHVGGALQKSLPEFSGDERAQAIEDSSQASADVVAFLRGWLKNHTGSVDEGVGKKFVAFVPVLASLVKSCSSNAGAGQATQPGVSSPNGGAGRGPADRQDSPQPDDSQQANDGSQSDDSSPED